MKTTKSEPISYDKVIQRLTSSGHFSSTGNFTHSRYDAAALFFYNYTHTIPYKILIHNHVGCTLEKITDELIKNKLIKKENAISKDINSEMAKEKGIKKIEQTIGSLLYPVDNNIWLQMEENYVYILYNHESNQETIKKVETCIHTIIDTEPKTSKLFLVEKTSFGYGLSSFEISNPSNDNLELYYNNDLKEVDKVVKSYMANANKTGIYIFHGPPGTGKTTYIRHLIANTERKVIYIPQMLTQYLGEPEFISFMIHNSKSILVIEDSEKFLMSRETDSYSFVGNLLNLTDGLLGDCLKMQVICTFNTGLEKIDQALLRKGRLLAKYDFDKLTSDKSNKLFKHLELEQTTIAPLSIAEIFNIKTENDFAKAQKPTIGFRTAAEQIA